MIVNQGRTCAITRWQCNLFLNYCDDGVMILWGRLDSSVEEGRILCIRHRIIKNRIVK